MSSKFKNDSLLSICKTGILERGIDKLHNTAETMTLVSGNTESFFMTRLDKETLKSLYNKVKSGSREAMHTVSMLYITGFGLPHSETDAVRWSSLSLLEATDISFDEALVVLRADIADILITDTSEAFVYPEFRTELPELIHSNLSHQVIDLDTIKTKLSRTKSTAVSLTPVFAGVRISVVYKISDDGKDCHMYDAFVEDGTDSIRFTLDVMSVLDVPMFLGEVRGKRTVIDYPARMAKHSKQPIDFKFFVVRGVLAVPASKKAKLATSFPNAKNTFDMVNELLKFKSVVRKQFIASESIDRLSRRCIATKAKARSYFTKYKRNSKKLKTEYIAIKKELDSVKLKDTVNKEELLCSYPEYYLSFIGTEIAGVTEQLNIHRLSLKPSDQAGHLSVLGFMTTSHQGLVKASTTTLDRLTVKGISSYVNLLSKLYGEYKLFGVLIQPNKDVTLNNRKDKQRYVYKL
jgi:hypothetical protein